MSFLRRKPSGRAGARASLLSGAAVAALAICALGAGSASANPPALKCTGGAILGAGSSLQKVAQTEVWNPGFNAAGVCPSGPKVTYESTGSGAGLKRWNANLEEGKINTGTAFVASDDGPSQTQLNNIESVSGGGKVAVIPVAQTSISVVANPPAGCEVEVITNPDLEAVFEGKILTWNKLEGAEGTCNSAITRVVRKDGSGTTFQFKNYLFALDKKGLFCTTGATEGKASWAELETIGAKEEPNINWPQSCGEKTLTEVTHSTENGGGALVNKVNETVGGIGYAALPDAEAHKTGSTVILNVQNNGQKKGGEAEFATPASGTTANCSAVAYKVPKTNGGLDLVWSSVFGAHPAIGGESYPLCTLTYILAFHGYKAAGFTEEQEITASDYLNGYIVQKAGQENINSHFYSSLPSSAEASFDVLGAARRASKEISY